MKMLDLQLLEKNIDTIAEHDFCNNQVFGSAYFVYQKGNKVFQKCYGKDGLNGNPITENTLFRLASMTKPITAIATLVLVQKGLLSLDDYVSKYIPQFDEIDIIDAKGNNCGKPKNKPTIRNILSHCSGIGSEPQKMCKITGKDKISLDASIEFMLKMGFDYDPTTTQIYSGFGAYDVLSRIIEMVTGTDYLSFLKKEVFEPCNMPDTTFIPSEEQLSRLVKMHTKKDDKNAQFEMPEGCIFENIPWTHFLGGAGLVSTLNDYSNFAKMIIDCGNTEKGEFLNKEICALMSQPQIQNVSNEYWGLGVRIISDSSYPYLPVGSFGWSGAYGSHFWIDPENELFAIYMKNSMIDGGAGNKSAVNFERVVYESLI